MTNKVFTQLGDYKVNNTFTIKDMGKFAFDELVDYAIVSTRYHHSYAQFNFNLAESGKTMGLRIYKDYGLYVSLVYPNKKGEYSSTEIAQIINNQVQYKYRYTDHSEELEKFLNRILKDRTVLEDYDRQQIENALVNDDFALLDDIIGDRDFAELI